MRIYNFKINKNKLFKGILLFFIMICLILLILSVYKLFFEMKHYNSENFVVNDTCISDNDTTEIKSNQYTNILKAVHENIDDYIGKKITFVGYIYRINYLQANQFVLARNMIVNQANQTVVVGFLSEYDNINNFANCSWVKVTGTIKKGFLDGDIPILEVTEIENVEKPADDFVYPPDETYVPTSATF